MLNHTTSPSGKGIISGHADGTIVRYFFEEDGAGLARVCGARVVSMGVNKTVCRVPFVITRVPRMHWLGQTPPSSLLVVIGRSLSMDLMVPNLSQCNFLSNKVFSLQGEWCRTLTTPWMMTRRSSHVLRAVPVASPLWWGALTGCVSSTGRLAGSRGRKLLPKTLPTFTPFQHSPGRRMGLGLLL